jgi:hypothetical protein
MRKSLITDLLLVPLLRPCNQILQHHPYLDAVEIGHLVLCFSSQLTVDLELPTIAKFGTQDTNKPNFIVNSPDFIK